MQHASLVMMVFQSVFDRLVQSNAAVMDKVGLEIIVQVVCNNRGGGVRRKLETMLNEEIVRKESCFLDVPHNSDIQLCFAVSLTSLIDPGLLCSQVVHLARELQHLVELNDQTPINLKK